ncbi:M23 family metallopeptidase [Microbacterium jejuense]|uniref:M23 family metallopeptidase n=1 Tax=Microbacterium jejuense TaxID=1263637 RepID=A0ABS7HLW4_9MICO|nr:M23 family metallopeptidase [Microbacterium jejuense]MBW9092888.1 M23 family metallopeptidase [Microbacterium jejuense]
MIAHPPARPTRWRRLAAGLLSAVLVLSGAASSGAAGAITRPPAATAVASETGWVWPAHPVRVERGFVAPPHAYGPGHRGIDLRPLEGGDVVAPAAGVIAFSGPVAGRGIVTIDHGDGLVTTLEPIDTTLTAGTPVGSGESVGSVALGGHVEPGVFHFGVRRDGEYINPLLLLGGVPRAVLLPCC